MTILLSRRTMLAAAALLLDAAMPAVAAPADGVALAPHRAVYDLKLLKSHGSRGVASVRGRILYDFSGNACDGYDLKFRQVSELDSGEGKAVLSDLNSTTWEDAQAQELPLQLAEPHEREGRGCGQRSRPNGAPRRWRST